MAPAANAPAQAERTDLAIITDGAQFQTALAALSKTFNVLTPFANVGGLAPQHAIFPTVIAISTDKAAGQVYDGAGGMAFLKDGEVALAKNGLRSIAEGLGISIHLEYPPHNRRHYWHVKAIAAYRGLDGAWVTREASFEWDLSEGSERIRGWRPNQILEGRKNGLRQCETRAINAAIRECGCGVKQAYTRAELAKPFVALRVNFVPDMNDPDTRRAVTERAMQGASALFAQQSHASTAAAAGDPFADDPIDAVPVGSGSTAAASAATTPIPPKADAPPCEGAVKIVDIKEFKGVKNGRPWTKWTIVDSNGVEASTFSKTDFDDATRFRAANEWVEIATELQGNYTNVIEIVKAGSAPNLPGLDEV